MTDYSTQIPALALECRRLAANIERNFGTVKVSRSAILRDAMTLESQAKRLGTAMRQWFDEMAAPQMPR